MQLYGLEKFLKEFHKKVLLPRGKLKIKKILKTGDYMCGKR